MMHNLHELRAHAARLTVTLVLACPIGELVAAPEEGGVRIPGTKVRLVAPQDFEMATQFSGLQQLDKASSVMITETRAPYRTTSGMLTAEKLLPQGMTLIASEKTRISSREAILVSVAQEDSGMVFRKWIALFGNDSETVMIVATFPEALAEDLSERLKAVVLSARWRPEAEVGRLDGLPYRIEETPSLKISGRTSNMLVLTKDGAPSPRPPGEPFVVVGASVRAVELDDVETFAKLRVRQTANVQDVGQITGKSITIDGAPGYELTAIGKDPKSGTPLVLYQALALKGGFLYVVQGLVGAAAGDRYLDEFREVTSKLSILE